MNLDSFGQNLRTSVLSIFEISNLPKQKGPLSSFHNHALNSPVPEASSLPPPTSAYLLNRRLLSPVSQALPLKFHGYFLVRKAFTAHMWRSMSQILPGSIFLPRNVIVCSDLTLTVKEKKSQIFNYQSRFCLGQ